MQPVPAQSATRVNKAQRALSVLWEKRVTQVLPGRQASGARPDPLEHRVTPARRVRKAMQVRWAYRDPQVPQVPLVLQVSRAIQDPQANSDPRARLVPQV